MTRQETLKQAFLETIKTIGIVDFKKCSMFGGYARGKE